MKTLKGYSNYVLIYKNRSEWKGLLKCEPFIGKSSLIFYNFRQAWSLFKRNPRKIQSIMNKFRVPNQGKCLRSNCTTRTPCPTLQNPLSCKITISISRKWTSIYKNLFLHQLVSYWPGPNAKRLMFE